MPVQCHPPAVIRTEGREEGPACDRKEHDSGVRGANQVDQESEDEISKAPTTRSPDAPDGKAKDPAIDSSS